MNTKLDAMPSHRELLGRKVIETVEHLVKEREANRITNDELDGRIFVIQMLTGGLLNTDDFNWLSDITYSIRAQYPAVKVLDVTAPATQAKIEERPETGTW